MVYLWKEWFLRGTYHKLKYKKIGPCKILKKIKGNAYEVNLPVDLNISHVFNISNLYIFYGDNLGDESEEEVDWKQANPSKKKEKIAHILDKNTIHTRKGEYNRYLVQWESLAPAESTWITEGDLMTLDPVNW